MWSTIQQDINNLESFFLMGPKKNFEYREKFYIKESTLSQVQMDLLILRNVKFTSGQKKTS
jgi:hypothetical protein